MRDKVLVLGSTGLIGHQVYNYFKESNDYELCNISYQNRISDDSILLDARDTRNFIDKIISIRPQYIVNCIGILVRKSNEDIENAIYLNSLLPHILVKLADKINAKLIHLSTDCVFSGNKKSPYIESDKKDGIGNYAKTKGLGEVYNDRHLTIRTSVVGPEIRNNGEGLFHWFMGQSDSIDGFTKVIWSGVTSLELARALKWSIDNSITGLYHVTNNSSISKHELLKLFQKYTNKDIIINPYDRIDLDKSFIDTRLLMDYKIPSYEQMIKQMIEFIRENDGLYRQYCL